MEIRRATERDEAGIRALFRMCFNRELSHEEWVWKYENAPWGSSAAVAIDGGEVVAHYGGLGVKFRCSDGTLDAFQPCDVMVHPGYRARMFSKRGLMVRVGEYFYATNRMDFAFGFPSERHAILGTKQLGYTEHNYVTVLKKGVSGSSSLKTCLLKVESGWDCITGEELDALWRSIRDSYELTIDKWSGYVFWRYRDRPLREYRPLILRSRYRGNLKALCIYSVEGMDLLIYDLFCPDETTGAFLGFIENLALRQGLVNMRLWLNPRERGYRKLVRSGFVPEKGIPYIFKIRGEGIDASFLLGSYCYSMGDYDAA